MRDEKQAQESHGWLGLTPATYLTVLKECFKALAIDRRFAEG
jgi:hypothetical protein